MTKESIPEKRLEFIKRFVKVRGIRNYQIWGHCPFHDDSNPSFSMNLEKGVWICFAENLAGSFSDFVRRINKDRVGEIAVDSLLMERPIEPEPEMKEVLIKKGIPLGRRINLEDGQEKELPLEIRNFLKEKRISLNLATFFGLNYFCFRKNDGGIFSGINVPVFSKEGEIKFYVSRLISPERKYFYPEGFKVKDYLFCENLVPQKVSKIYITEGVFHAIRLSLFLDSPVLATFGASLSKRQLQKILSFKPKKVIICYDSDKAGETGGWNAFKLLSAFIPTVFAYFPKEKDPNDMTDEEIKKWKENLF